jgi:hypothetical protein
MNLGVFPHVQPRTRVHKMQFDDLSTVGNLWKRAGVFLIGFSRKMIGT